MKTTITSKVTFFKEKQILFVSLIFILYIVGCKTSSKKSNIIINDNEVHSISNDSLKTNPNLKNDMALFKTDSTLKNIDPDLKKIIKKLKWSGQSSIKIEFNDQVIYIDPFQIKVKDSADIVLITHSHDDHLSINELKKISNTETKFFAPKDCCQKLIDNNFQSVTEVIPLSKLKIVSDISIEVVPAYNIIKTQFHPKENNWVGYILNLGGIKIYHPGDTEKIPEMKNIDCDIAFMPLGQNYTMNSVDEAVEAIIEISPRLAIPFHFGIYEGTKQDAKKFKELLKDKVDVIILNR